jgi:hypothetical protein
MLVELGQQLAVHDHQSRRRSSSSPHGRNPATPDEVSYSGVSMGQLGTETIHLDPRRGTAGDQAKAGDRKDDRKEDRKQDGRAAVLDRIKELVGKLKRKAI